MLTSSMKSPVWENKSTTRKQENKSTTRKQENKKLHVHVQGSCRM